MLSSLLPPYSPNVWRAIFTVGALIVLLVIVLFTVDRCSTYRDNKKVNEHKANIANIAANIKKMETGVIPATKEEIAAQKAAANVETGLLLDAVGATDEAREATNAALANLEAAKGKDTTNSSVKDLEDALRRLE